MRNGRAPTPVAGTAAGIAVAGPCSRRCAGGRGSAATAVTAASIPWPPWPRGQPLHGSELQVHLSQAGGLAARGRSPDFRGGASARMAAGRQAGKQAGKQGKPHREVQQAQSLSAGRTRCEGQRPHRSHADPPEQQQQVPAARRGSQPHQRRRVRSRSVAERQADPVAYVCRSVEA